jgi:hypothetical protein
MLQVGVTVQIGIVVFALAEFANTNTLAALFRVYTRLRRFRSKCIVVLQTKKRIANYHYSLNQSNKQM